MKKGTLIIFLVFTFISCNRDDNLGQNSFYQDYYDENILIAMTNFKHEIKKQITITERFVQNTTKENFNDLQNQWVVTAKSYSRVTPYNIAKVKSKFLDILIYNFSISPDLIENNIKEKTDFNSSYFSSKSTSTKGLGTVEYLLFHEQNKDVALSLLQQDNFRLNYLLNVSKNILEQANQLLNFWETQYKEIFITSTNDACSENARCLSFNQLINTIDVIRVTKVGKPAGLESSSNTAVKTLQAYRSENSLELIKSTLKEIQNAYSLSATNFSKEVNAISGSEHISNSINNTFGNIFKTIATFDISLYQAILNKSHKVTELYNLLFELVRYFSIDAASTLSVNILPTDNDGD